MAFLDRVEYRYILLGITLRASHAGVGPADDPPDMAMLSILSRSIAGATALLLLVASAAHALDWETRTANEFLPEPLSISVQHRARYEYLHHQFRSFVPPGNEEVIALRTLVDVNYRLFEDVLVGVELEDSRVYRADDVFLNTTIGNAVELLRAYVAVELDDVAGGSVFASGGRLTMDVGSRRFVARNRYRNTINGFTGVDVRWVGGETLPGTVLRAFWTLPVQRLPNRPAALRDNGITFDRETLSVQFWGLFAGQRLAEAHNAELFFFRLDEGSTEKRPTQARDLYTIGFRFFSPPRPGFVDYQVEGAYQFGRSTPRVIGRRLDVFSHFHHGEVGYSVEAPLPFRVAAQFDYASGDRDPLDQSWERFNTLYGARRFDFGPTGIYGPFARTNLLSPGVRVQTSPWKTVNGFLAYRGYWLASSRDAWVPARVSDPTGEAGSFIGSQVELALRWFVLPGNVSVEVGYAHLFAGSFIRQASDRPGSTDYAYVQTVLAF